MLIKKIKSEYDFLRKEISAVEYAFWWLVRILLFAALLSTIKAGNNDFLDKKIRSNFLLTFAFPAVHLLPRRFFPARLDYRVQSVISAMLLVTSFFGQYKGFYSTKEWFDLYLHFFGCFFCVYLGYELVRALLNKKEGIEPSLATISGFGLSFFFAVAWEIFEFISDSIYPMSNAQNWSCYNSDRLIALLPPMDPARLALIDTRTDRAAGSLGSILGAIALYIYLKYKQRKS